jgi:CheY-like chemotaxis protein
LGLYSLSKRTEALGGKCGVTRRADGQQGCAFWFSVPYRPDKAYEDATKAAQAAAMKTFSQAITPSLARQVANLHSIDSTVSMVDSQNSTPMSTLALLAAQDALSSSEVKHRRVLVVDDSLTIMKMVSRTLEQHGFVVDTAKNGFVGLKKMMEANLSTDEPLVSEGSTSSSSVKASRERERERERDTREKEKTKGKDKEKSKPLPYDLVLMDIQMPVMGE